MLTIHKLTKSYGKYLALDQLDLKIRPGEIYGFVGPNGAGKTTTMKICAGLMKADSGEVVIDGINALENNRELKKRIGYMPDFFGVYDNLKTIEYMEFYAAIYGITGKEARTLCMELLDSVQLKDQYDNYVDSLSRGMKQRLCLARCLVHGPKLLILDEPASGLDPRARVIMKDILRRLSAEGMTILISSHILPELAQICTHAGIIEKGKLVLSGSIEEITSARGSTRPIVLRMVDNQEATVRVIRDNPFTKKITILENVVSLLFTGNQEEEAALLTSIIQGGGVISSFAREESSLEALFLQITHEEGS